MKEADKSEQPSGSLHNESDKALLTIDLSALALDCVYTRIKSLGIAPSPKIFEAALGLLKCKSKKDDICH